MHNTDAHSNRVSDNTHLCELQQFYQCISSNKFGFVVQIDVHLRPSWILTESRRNSYIVLHINKLNSVIVIGWRFQVDTKLIDSRDIHRNQNTLSDGTLFNSHSNVVITSSYIAKKS